MQEVVKQTPGGLVYSEMVEEPKEQPAATPPVEEYDLVSGQSLLTVFQNLPKEAQVEVFARIKRALLRRGGGRIFHAPREGLIHELADVFYRNGHEQEEYT